MELCTPTDEARLRNWAAGHHGACHAPGEPGYCSPKKANWSIEVLSAEPFTHIWATPKEAREWIDEEIQMDIDDEMHRDWATLLTEPIREEIYCLVRDGKAYIWDGHHRAAALIATDRPIVAIVGRPMQNELEPVIKVTTKRILPSRQPLWDLDTNTAIDYERPRG